MERGCFKRLRHRNAKASDGAQHSFTHRRWKLVRVSERTSLQFQGGGCPTICTVLRGGKQALSESHWHGARYVLCIFARGEPDSG